MPDWLVQGAVIVSAVASFGSPLMVYMLNHFHEKNKSTLLRIEGKIEHVDDCVDHLKQRISRMEGKLGMGDVI